MFDYLYVFSAGEYGSAVGEFFEASSVLPGVDVGAVGVFVDGGCFGRGGWEEDEKDIDQDHLVLWMCVRVEAFNGLCGLFWEDEKC